MSQQPLRLLILGAHPDDADVHAGGLAAIYRQLGHSVKMVSVTDGGAGHHQHRSKDLVRIRRQEASAAGQVIGVAYETWDNPDGSLQPTLDLREQIIREIRTYQPDLVLTHRTNDYHPDHRAVGQAVQDASYMVTVPLVVPDVPILRRDPVVAYMYDRFTKPTSIQPDVVVDVTEHVDTIVAMLACHRSQVFEFLPFNKGNPDEVPKSEEERLLWLRNWYERRERHRADRFRDRLIEVYGTQRGSVIEFCEVYEISEYASSLDDVTRQRLFSFA